MKSAGMWAHLEKHKVTGPAIETGFSSYIIVHLKNDDGGSCYVRSFLYEQNVFIISKIL